MTAMDPDMSAAGPLIRGALTTLVLVGGLGLWSVLASLSGAIIAPGLIEVSQSRQVVQHPEGGIVTEIRVSEGDVVASGQVLVRLDGSALRADLALVQSQILAIRAQSARLEAQRDAAETITFPADLLAEGLARPEVGLLIDGQVGVFEKQAATLGHARDQRRQRIDQIRDQIRGLAAQQDAVEAELLLLAADLSTQRALLAKGLTEAPRISAIERDLARLRGRAGELAAARAEALGRVTEIEIEIASLATRQAELAELELRDLSARQLDLTGHAKALALRVARLEVRAPAAGIVFGLRVTTPQAVLRAADPLMFIVPQDRPLLVVARVPAADVDEVHPGQKVRLVFSSLSAAATPDREGRITVVSADALMDERTGIAYFRAEIALEADVDARTPDTGILPGMPVQSFIRTADRSPLSYLLQPFTDYFRQAFRET